MKPILKCLHEMPDFQFCHWTWLSMSLDSLSIPFVPFVRKYTERATCFQQSVRASMLKCYWIGLGGAGDSAYDSTAGLQVSHWWQRAAPHVDVVQHPCALPLGAFSAAPASTSRQFLHHLPTADAGGLTEFLDAALGNLLWPAMCFKGH